MVVDWDGRILAQADPGPGEKVVVAPIDVATLRSERARRKGHDMRAHLRGSLHTYLDSEHLPPASDPADITTDSINRRIAAGKKTLEGDRS